MKKKILILDDSPFMLTVTGALLKEFGYDVTTVDNGIEACQLVKAEHYDMIITDMNMPGMDGLQFTQQVRTYPGCRFLPIIMLSSDENIEKVSQAKKLGVSTFLRKPLNEGQLKSILHIVLSKRKSPRMQMRTEVYLGNQNIGSSYTVNISTGGMFIESKTPLPIGEELELKFFVSDDKGPVACRGRVAWVNSPLTPILADHPPGMGIEFLSGVDEQVMRSLLQSHSRKY